MRKLVAIVLLSLFSSGSYAALALCDSVSIDKVFAIGDRDDGSANSNMLLVSLKDPATGQSFKCQGMDYVYIKNNHAAYSGIMSVILSADATGRKIGLQVNTSKQTSNAVEIAYVWAIN